MICVQSLEIEEKLPDHPLIRVPKISDYEPIRNKGNERLSSKRFALPLTAESATPMSSSNKGKDKTIDLEQKDELSSSGSPIPSTSELTSASKRGLKAAQTSSLPPEGDIMEMLRSLGMPMTPATTWEQVAQYLKLFNPNFSYPAKMLNVAHHSANKPNVGISDIIMANTTQYKESIEDREARIEATRFVNMRVQFKTVTLGSYPNARKKIFGILDDAEYELAVKGNKKKVIDKIKYQMMRCLVAQLDSQEWDTSYVNLRGSLTDVIAKLDREYNEKKGDMAARTLRILIGGIPMDLTEISKHCELVMLLRGMVLSECPITDHAELAEIYTKHLTWEEQYQSAFVEQFTHSKRICRLLMEYNPTTLEEFKKLCHKLAGNKPQKVLVGSALYQTLHTLTNGRERKYVRRASTSPLPTTPSKGTNKSSSKLSAASKKTTSREPKSSAVLTVLRAGPTLTIAAP